jgi:proline racemase
LETGMIRMIEPVTELVLEAPAGLIRIRCSCKDGKVTSVEFENQPAFVYRLDVPLELEGFPTLTVDVAWGGMAYVLAQASELGIALTPDEGRDLCDLGQRLKAAAAEQIPVKHPINPEFAGITQTEFVGPLERCDGVLASRNAVVVSPGRLDRSPCGTGTSARLAVLKARGLINVGERFNHESVIGSVFASFIERTTTVGPYDAVVPRISGQAYITEISQVGLDPADPFPTGYKLSDTWPQDD